MRQDFTSCEYWVTDNMRISVLFCVFFKSRCLGVGEGASSALRLLRSLSVSQFDGLRSTPGVRAPTRDRPFSGEGPAGVDAPPGAGEAL